MMADINQTSQANIIGNISLQLSSFMKRTRLSAIEALKQTNKFEPEFLDTLLLIENVPCTLTDFRDRERHLESLKRLLSQESLLNCRETNISAFRYLLGSLYVNFKPFWDPTIRITTAITKQSKHHDELLSILIKHLQETDDIIYDENPSDKDCEDRPDHILHRNFIFQLLEQFPQQVHRHHIEFMNEFFRFVSKELLVSPFIEKYTRDNLTKDCRDSVDQGFGEEENPNHQATTSGATNRHQKNGKKKVIPAIVLQKRKSRETYITSTKILRSLGDVSSLHRHDELKNLMLDLLCCRDSSVQRASYKCLEAFNIRYLQLYSEKISKIMSDKMIKTEITLFSIDADETDQVLTEHRPQLMQVLLRILFGKMIGKVGHKSSGRNKADKRKEVVMRFVAGCTSEEILYFFRLLFDSIFDYINLPYERLEAGLEDELDLTNYVPLNKLQAMLSSLSIYMESIAHLKEDTLPQVLKLINIIIYFVIKPLETQEYQSRINHKRINTLKALRRECLQILSDFFRSFSYYNYQQVELDFIFKNLIWTSTQGFIDRNYATPTPMLRLIESLACNVTYHPLLVKRNPIDNSEYLLRHVIELYQNTKTQRPTLKFIASILADVIKPDRNTTEDEDDMQVDQTEPIKILEGQDCVIPEYDETQFMKVQELRYGQKILLSSTSAILGRLEKNCKDFVTKKDKNSRIENDELIVLSELSCLIQNPGQSLAAAKLLLTTLNQQKKADLIISTLKTIQLLLDLSGQIVDPSVVNLIANIISFQRNLTQRREMCNLIEILAKGKPHLSTISRAILLMNYPSDEFIDSIDLLKWTEGFELAFDFIDELQEEDMNNEHKARDSLLLLINQVCFMINNCDLYKDISTQLIRDKCDVFFEKLGPKLNLINIELNKSLIEELIDDTLIKKFLRKGLRETNETTKHLFIGVLRSLAVSCHERHPTLKEFYLFCSDNPDQDFWLNIKNIQLQNRSRALARLIKNQKLSQVSAKTLSSYFMPIAAGFLFTKSYKSVSKLAENSIELIGIICKRLNWKTYESTLAYYLDLLTKANATYQKTNINLITEILKNFNFDISQCQEAMQYEEENAKLEKRMKKRLGTSSKVDDTKTVSEITKRKLNPSTARMVYFSITKKLIPRMESCLHEMTRTEFEHDKNMSNYLPEKEEIKRISMAYAIIQLLNLLPGKYVLFKNHLPSLLLKLTSFLKSKDETVRKVARRNLVKVMMFVGPMYIPELLRELKQNLCKGFQVHVLNYTIHSVLDKMELHYGCLDLSMSELINSCFQEIFGKIAEDKTVAQILAKTFEAKKTKSYDTLMIISSHISDEKLDYLMNSVREVSRTSSDKKKVNKLATCIQKIFTGLAKNEDFPMDRMLDFIQSTIEESIPNLKVRQTIEEVVSAKQSRPVREDRHLITKDKPRTRIESRINEKGNFHMTVENSLRLLLHVFQQKKEMIKRKDTDKQKLDGFIGLLSTCLKSSSPSCVTRSLKCIYFITKAKADLPSFKTKANSIVKKIFILLSLYNGVGMVQGENLDMITMCFKTLTSLLLRCEHVKLNDDQVRALFTYIEQDLHDPNRQATAFSSLNSLLHKKCESPELDGIMKKVADLLITSHDDKIRLYSIKIWQTYLLEYRHETNKLQTYLNEFLRQLNYNYIDGRKSALKMINVIVTKFPLNLLRDYWESMFILLAHRLIDEESKPLRKQVGQLLGLLMQRLPDKQEYAFKKFVLPWAKTSDTQSTSSTKEKPSAIDIKVRSDIRLKLKILGIKLMSIFVECCQRIYTSDGQKLKHVISALVDGFEVAPDRPEISQPEDSGVESIESNENPKESTNKLTLLQNHDKLTYHSSKLFLRILTKKLISPIEENYINDLKKIWHDIANRTLTHWHLPIVLASCELYSIFLTETDLQDALNVDNPNSSDYLNWNAKRIVTNLCDKLLSLLDRANESDQLLYYITTNMITLGVMVARSRSTLEFEDGYIESFEEKDILKYMLTLDDLPDDGFVQDRLPYNFSKSKQRLNLMWLAVKVVMQARKEAAVFRTSSNHRRDFVMEWSAAIMEELGPKRVTPYVFLFTMTPVRELTDKGKNKLGDNKAQLDTLRKSEDLLKFIKNLVDVKLFDKIYSKVQLHFTKRRLKRKKEEALMKVKDQARGVKRKMKKSHDKAAKRKVRLNKQ